MHLSRLCADGRNIHEAGGTCRRGSRDQGRLDGQGIHAQPETVQAQRLDGQGIHAEPEAVQAQQVCTTQPNPETGQLHMQVTCGSTIKLQHAKTSHYLHSHEVSYGALGSGQQSVTGAHNMVLQHHPR